MDSTANNTIASATATDVTIASATATDVATENSLLVQGMTTNMNAVPFAIYRPTTAGAPFGTTVYPNSIPTTQYPYPQVSTAGGAASIPLQDGLYIPQPVIQYKFNESAILDKAKAYIDSTYAGHYSEKDGIQALDFIMANSESYDFLKGNVLKYTARYGKKEGHNPKDILKAIHYLIILYYFSLEKK
jgi:hypothetical protein